VTIPQHSAESVEHYTPDYIVEPARAVLGAIDLDPASCPIGQEVVRAAQWYGEKGLERPWAGRVFLNPPGGLAEIKGCGTNSNAVLWWSVLAEYHRTGAVSSAVFVGFTLEILSTAQAMNVPQPLDFPYCVSRGRTCFDLERAREITRLEKAIGECTKERKLRALHSELTEVRAATGNRVRSKQPTHANVFVYLPPANDVQDSVGVERFRQLFSEIGKVVIPDGY
jgi:hypothetical protein